ncbi:cell division protein SepF [Leucobacter sp. CSA2]|uniref:Cell division protein SepF n=1 Tax=Leucobacter edaphi TaxID=2796472 RepID=A0A934UXN3_9MICO|nr:cell division protein SepF [Leucobacter edaphi]MBK0421503.1 cell division protein SepF [Leucobacter edaphi]
MSNPLKKTMVFLGLAEEDLEEQNAQQQQSAAPAPRQASQQSQAPKAETPRPAPQRASVTPLRRVTPTRSQQAQPLNEILTLRPAKYGDAKVVGENFREGIPVIINLSDMGDAEAKRLIDFASGLAMGLRGRIERVTSKVFLLTPEHIETGGDEDARQGDSGSFFVAPSA